MRALERPQAWISGPPAWSHLVQVTVVCCSGRALFLALPVPLSASWALPPSPTAHLTVNALRGPLSQGNPAAAPSHVAGLPGSSSQTSLRPELFTSYLAGDIVFLQLAMCFQTQQGYLKSGDVLRHPAQCQANTRSKVTTF